MEYSFMIGWLFIVFGYLLSLVGLPGPLLMILGIFIWILGTASTTYSLFVLTVLIVLLVLAETAEQLGGLIGMSASGLGKEGWWGTIIGMGVTFVPAILTLNPLLILAGMVIGGISGELYRGASLEQSIKTLLGFLLGKAGGYAIKVLICSITFFYLLITTVLNRPGT